METPKVVFFYICLSLQIHKFLTNDRKADGNFGRSVAVYGNYVLIGAYQRPDGAKSGGAAYMFHLLKLTKYLKLQPSDPKKDDWFGYSVAITDKLALIGAPHVNETGGAAYLFYIKNGSQIQKFQPANGTSHNFGSSVSFLGKYAIIGDQNGRDDLGHSIGSVYLFNITTGLQVQKITAYDAHRGAGFGASMATDGTNLIIGAKDDSCTGKNKGAVYMWKLPDK